LEFEYATLEEEETEELQEFEFETVTVNARGKIIQRQTLTAFYFVEPLPNQARALDMVLIPGGPFLMGSPEIEEGHLSSESPQHLVTVPPFFMGRYPVTQAQWQAVMGENPSQFKQKSGENLPVENVSWHDAVEFCQKLSELTGRTYRLPSEAEWEYACRVRTTTPFHFGETMTTELANYHGDYSYGSGPKGEYREETTSVGSFPANAFGLQDMHGNVWEWCLDHWHKNYKGAPTDGSAWLTEKDDSYRVLRGGSWILNPGLCRSAIRDGYDPGNRYDFLGFRVACVSPGTL
jgi:eukaryotic-like serine/threonine-protein kinase